jgi:predicted restriction endonuclease
MVWSEESKKKQSERMKGHIVSDITKNKISKTITGYKYQPTRRTNAGFKHTEEHKQRMVERFTGDKNPAWKGGVKPLALKIRHSREMQEWRMQVFGRDNFTCQVCGVRGVYLEAHHIKPFADFPELRFDISNGITYCRPCHIKNDTIRGRNRHYKM